MCSSGWKTNFKYHENGKFLEMTLFVGGNGLFCLSKRDYLSTFCIENDVQFCVSFRREFKRLLETQIIGGFVWRGRAVTLTHFLGSI